MKKTIHSFLMRKGSFNSNYLVIWNNSNVFDVQNCQFVLFDTVIN